MKKRFSEEPIIGFLREADVGVSVKDLCRRYGFSEASYYLWRGKFGGMTVSETLLQPGSNRRGCFTDATQGVETSACQRNECWRKSHDL